MDTYAPLPSLPRHSAHPAQDLAQDVRITCYENDIPPFAGPGIDHLYGHLYASPAYFETARAMADANLYVARAGDTPVAILPYKLDGDAVTVVNEYMTVDEVEIRRFAAHMFSRYASVRSVTFPKVHTRISAPGYPCHAMICSEDMVVRLPGTVKEYEAAVGKNMRRNIKRYSSALSSAFPSYRYALYLERDIREQDLRDIVALSCLRMQSKNIVPRFDETEIRWIVDFAKTCGIAGVARIDGKVCAGAIGFRIGDNYFMHVIAHDPRYNDFSLGILCYYHTICEGIARGAKRFHLLQGRYGYKYRLLAERQDIIHLDIYRSRRDALSCIRHIARKEARGRLWLAKQWLLHDVERKEGKAYRFLGKIVNALRGAKRSREMQGGAPSALPRH